MIQLIFIPLGFQKQDLTHTHETHTLNEGASEEVSFAEEKLAGAQGSVAITSLLCGVFLVLMRRHLAVTGDSHMDLSHWISISNS